jgi:pyruvate dehydrogenase E1 component
VLASTVPSVEAWDPAFAYEMAVIIRDGLRRMIDAGEDVIYYLTLYNENYVMPPMPEGAEAGVLDGIYRWAPAPDGPAQRATILFSGTAQRAARDAQAELSEHFDVGAELWSVTSWKKLREDALSAERWSRLHPGEATRIPLVADQLGASEGPIVAVTDYMKIVPDQISRWVRRPFVALGTDGFGRSDTREQLRRYFETDAGHVVVAVLSALAEQDDVKPEVVADAIKRYGIDADRLDPWHT